MKLKFGFVAALLATGMLAACGSQMEPARKAVADAEASIAQLKDEAAKYVPNQLEAVDQKLAALKAAMEKQDYAAVVTGAPALLAETKALAETVVAKKAEYLAALKGDWTNVSAAVPQSVAAIEARLAELAAAKKLPEGITKDTLTAARTRLDEARSEWTGAAAAFGAGRLEEAVAKGQSAKARADQLMQSLGIGADAATADAAKPATPAAAKPAAG
jgi:DNA repair exonuclease SbcCD ATPase subunit